MHVLECPRSLYVACWKGPYQVVQNLVTDDLYHLERLHRSNRIHQDIPMDPNEVLGIKYTVFILEQQLETIVQKHNDIT
jgi:hypothetical protein